MGGKVRAARLRRRALDDETSSGVARLTASGVLRDVTVEDVGGSRFLISEGRGHLIGLGKGVHVYDGGSWIRVPGYEFAAW